MAGGYALRYAFENTTGAAGPAFERRTFGILRPEAEAGFAPRLRGLLGTLGSGRSPVVLGARIHAVRRTLSSAG